MPEPNFRALALCLSDQTRLLEEHGVSLTDEIKSGLNQMREDALECWNNGEDVGILAYMSNQVGLGFVVDNHLLLKERGTYEECLLSAYTSCRVNWSSWSNDLIYILFATADRDKLLALGDTLPDQEKFTLFRGVAGKGKKRRVRGFSWTSNPNCAAFFAMRFVEDGGLEDPAVLTITGERDDILCYLNESYRNEQEYLILPSRGMRPKRVIPFPDFRVYQKEVQKHRNEALNRYTPNED